ncbi:Imm21 family immunity protein [Streptomyces sp. NPDC060002]|uniref:Imm21 family immunity protein n=1 Tax=Streptomyces sp. NPDC060002 TaxID=3347033 RepID=UPI0036BD8FF1
MPLTWLETEGGPLIVVPRTALPLWPGTEGDYDRACEMMGFVGALALPDGAEALVLGDEPLSGSVVDIQFRNRGLRVHSGQSVAPVWDAESQPVRRIWAGRSARPPLVGDRLRSRLGDHAESLRRKRGDAAGVVLAPHPSIDSVVNVETARGRPTSDLPSGGGQAHRRLMAVGQDGGP